MTNEIATPIQKAYSVQLGEADVAFLRDVQRLADAVQNGTCCFSEFVSAVWSDLRAIGNHKFDVSESIAQGFRPQVASVVQNESNGKGGPNSIETKFLKDIHGVIEFVIRNDLSFLFPLDILIHDLQEIRSENGSLEKAIEKGFLPKASGWSKLNEEEFGEAEEPM